MFTKLSVCSAFALALATGTPEMALAKENGVKNVPKGQIQRQKNGLKPIPPGQIKRYTKGNILPKGLKWDLIDDLIGWNLKPLKKGEKYVKVGADVLRINDELEVIENVGEIAKLMK